LIGGSPVYGAETCSSRGEPNGEEFMRNLLIATAALSLIGGAAFAQNSSMTTPPTDHPSAETPAGVGQGGQIAGGMTPANADGTPSTASAPPAAPMSSDTGTSAPSTTDTASAPAPADASSSAMASAAPESYPVCTSKHEDRCVNRSQATRTAMVHHHMHRQASTESQPSGM
jgi:hypothetical protein